MKKVYILLLSLVTLTAQAQDGNSNKEKAREYGMQGIKLMDEGNIQQSLALLENARTLDPEAITYPYEIAYAHYLNKDYEKAIAQFSALLNHKEVMPSVYQMLGNAYDLNGNKEKALQTYKQGMKRFPDVGNFYLESGNIAFADKEYDKAMKFWEEGVKVDPNYPSNYYRLAILFSYTEEKIWSIFYGELFMNLERGTKRTKEMSELLYDNYKNSYTMNSDTSGEFHLTKSGFTIVVNGKKDMKKMLKRPLLPFEGQYATLYALAGFQMGGNPSMQAICDTRAAMVDLWFDPKRNTALKDYSNALLDYQKQLKEKGFMDAYSFWLLSEGDDDAFKKWYYTHSDEYDRFIAYFKEHGLELQKKQLYARTDYIRKD